jgi:signal peptidase I
MAKKRRRKKKSGGKASQPHPQAEAKEGDSPDASRWLWEWAKSIAIAVLLFLVIRTFVVEAFKIPTGSMETTLLVGDWLLVNKAVYGARVPFTGLRVPAFDEPERGDIVVFRFPLDPSESYVKRVVGTPGDRVAMRDGEVLVNGESQLEKHVRHIQPETDYYDPQFEWQRTHLAPEVDATAYSPSRDNWGPILVPEGNFFVMGDNRDNSLDSRYWGFVERGLIKGQPLFIYYSYDAEKLRPIPWLTEIRWSRLGHVVR